MRKKQHKSINPQNKEFDKYYMINYLVNKINNKNKQKQEYNFILGDVFRKLGKTGRI
jgi:hypothetical protein